MATFTLTANPTSLKKNEASTLTVTADSTFKDSVDFSGTTVNGSTFIFNPASLFLCNSDVKTAQVTITSVPTADTLTVYAVGGGVSQHVEIDLIPDTV